jgi:hypothetical protein
LMKLDFTSEKRFCTSGSVVLALGQG